MAEALQNIESTENPFVNLFVTLDVFDRNYSKALDWLSTKSEDIDNLKDLIVNYRQYARIYMYTGKKDLAKKYYNDARSILESKIEEGPEDRPFSYLLLLPVGLADFMARDATAEFRGRQRVLLRNAAEKNRAFSRARPVNREEVTVSPTRSGRTDELSLADRG